MESTNFISYWQPPVFSIILPNNMQTAPHIDKKRETIINKKKNLKTE